MPYLTGDDTGAVVDCRTLGVPDDLYFRMAVRGALLELTRPENWEQFGDQTPEQYAELADKMVTAFFVGQCYLTEGTGMELIAQYPLQTATVSQISLTGIPDTHQHLLVVIRARSDAADNFDQIELSFQTDASGKFNWSNMYTAMVDASHFTEDAINDSKINLGGCAGSFAPADLLGHSVLWIHDYASEVYQKALLQRSFATDIGDDPDFWGITDGVALWNRPTWKVEEINIVPAGGSNFLQAGVDVYGLEA